MSEHKPYVGHYESMHLRWQVFNDNYIVPWSQDPVGETRKRFGSDPKPWVARYGQREDANFATHAEALAYALSEAAK